MVVPGSRIYFAGPLFCAAELEYNASVASKLRMAGYEVVLPQEVADLDVGLLDPESDKREIMTQIFAADLEEIDSCDVLVLNIDGRVPDEGGCFELGYAFARGKRCYGLKTDVRCSEYGMDNAMLLGSLDGRIAPSVEALISMMESDF